MKRYRTVIFDCDSTLSTIEGVEELASSQRDEVAALTEAAMRGEVPLEAVYGRRLDLVRPTREQVEAVGRRYVETLLPDAREVVSALLREGIQVRILSGGLRPAVLIAGSALGIPPEDIEAVDIHFDARGGYAGYDSGSPLTRSGGKREVLADWSAGLRRPIMLVGDGATDLEARTCVNIFVAFAGVVYRPSVAEGSDVTIRAASLAPILPLALGGRPPQDPSARRLYDRGLRGLDPRDRMRSESAPEKATRPRAVDG